MSAVNENYNPGMNQSKFTHADFVQYLQNIDDIASPPKNSPSPSKGRASSSPVVKEMFTPNSTSKTNGVHRTLKAQISDLELQNKQLSEELRRARKDLERKGGGPGEGVSWFSASSMKSKMQQMEAQWKQDTDRRVSKCLADANKQLVAKLEEQAVAMVAAHRAEMEDALERQAADLTANFEYRAQTSKQEYDQRFESVLSDVEHHKQEVIQNQEQREAYHKDRIESLEAELAEVTDQLNAVTQVDSMGRAAEMEASEERWEQRFKDYKVDFEQTLDSKVEAAVAQKQEEMEANFAIREREMDSAYSSHLTNTIKQCESECAEVAGRRLEEVKQEAEEAQANIKSKLEQAKNEIESLKLALEQEAANNTENLNRLAGLKSSANEAQQKRLADKYKTELEQLKQQEKERTDIEIRQYQAKLDAKREEELSQMLDRAKASWEDEMRNEFEQNKESLLLECSESQAEEINNLTLSFENELNNRSREMCELEDKLRQSEEKRTELEANLSQDLIALRERLEAEKQAEIDRLYASSGSNEGQMIADLSEQLKVQERQHREELESMKTSSKCQSGETQKASSDLLTSESTSQLLCGSSPLLLGLTSVLFGATLALVLLILGSLFIQPNNMMQNQPHAF